MAGEWSSESARAALESDGVAVMPRFLSEDEAGELRAVVFAVYDDLQAQQSSLPSDLANHFTMWNGVWVKALPAFLAAHNVPLLERFRRLSNLICRKVHKQFGEQWRLYPERTYFRRHVGVAKKVPWHIDADAAHTWRRHCFNVWIPLDEVGINSPSLDVIPGSQRTMRDLPLLTGADRYREDDFAMKIGTPIVPKMIPGDAMAFDQFTLHRTQCVGTESTVRTACEFRFQRGFTQWISAAQSVLSLARRVRATLPI